MNFRAANSTKVTLSREQLGMVEAFLLCCLQAELPPHLTYHNATYTIDVIHATNYLLQREGVPNEDRWLLLTGALFHDAGFLRTYDNHEEHSCDVAWEMLPGFGYIIESIEAICRLIRATRLPQIPLDHYEQIIYDADLSNLGTVAFSITAEQLYNEWRAAGHVLSEEERTAKQIHFLKNHRYFTGTAKVEMKPGKRRHIRSIRNKIQRAKGKK